MQVPQLVAVAHAPRADSTEVAPVMHAKFLFIQKAAAAPFLARFSRFSSSFKQPTPPGRCSFWPAANAART